MPAALPITILLIFQDFRSTLNNAVKRLKILYSDWDSKTVLPHEIREPSKFKALLINHCITAL